MIDKIKREQIIKLIKREVVPALGCTEPMAVALCVSKATELLGSRPDKIEVTLSGNMLKNAMGVGIPGTGLIGLPIAIALGALKGKSSLGLEVLSEVEKADVKEGQDYIKENRIKITHDPETPSNLHIEVKVVSENGDSAEAVISGSHTNFVFLRKGKEIIEDKRNENETASVADSDDIILDLKTVWDFATTSPLDEIEFILEAKKLNERAAAEALKEDYGHSLGSLMRKEGKNLFGDTILTHIISNTSAACDARMGGAQIAVMSNSGSGNQGICCTMPVVSFAEDINADREQLIRALIMSNLTSIYIKQSLGRLSALCGCVVASTGASAGIVYLMKGDYPQVCYAVKNMVANLTGMICDGAKPSCSLKISSGVSTALMSAMLAMNEKCVTSTEGIVDDDVDKTIHNLTMIGKDAMIETDKLVLKIMTNK